MARFAIVALIALSTACLNPAPVAVDSDGIESPEGTGTDDADQDECLADLREPNEEALTATRLSWDSVSSSEGLDDAGLAVDAFLCSGEHDWYLLPIPELDFDFHVVRIDGLVAGASWCGHFDSCEGEVLPDAPENTLAVEVYDAASMVLLAADIATNGRVDVDGWGPNFSKELLVHVYGPSVAASYAYELHVDIRSYDAEDDCEC